MWYMLITLALRRSGRRVRSSLEMSFYHPRYLVYVKADRENICTKVINTHTPALIIRLSGWVCTCYLYFGLKRCFPQYVLSPGNRHPQFYVAIALLCFSVI